MTYILLSMDLCSADETSFIDRDRMGVYLPIGVDNGNVQKIVESIDRKYLVIGGGDVSTIWDASTSTELAQLDGAKSAVFADNDHLLLLGNRTGSLRLVRLSDRVTEKSWLINDSPIFSYARSAKNPNLFVTHSAKKIVVFDSVIELKKYEIDITTSPCRKIFIDDTRDEIACLTMTGNFHLFDLHSGRSKGDGGWSTTEMNEIFYFSSDKIFYRSNDDDLYLARRGVRQSLKINAHPAVGRMQVAISTDGHSAAISLGGGEIAVIKKETVKTFSLGDNSAIEVTALTWSGDAKTIFIGLANQSELLIKLNAETGEKTGSYARVQRQPVRSAVAQSGGDYFFTASGNGYLNKWHSRTLKIENVFFSSEQWTSLDVAPNDEFVAVGSAAGVVRLVDANTNKVVFERKLHNGIVNSVRFFPNKKMGKYSLLTSGQDGVVKVTSLSENHIFSEETVFQDNWGIVASSVIDDRVLLKNHIGDLFSFDLSLGLQNKLSGRDGVTGASGGQALAPSGNYSVSYGLTKVLNLLNADGTRSLRFADSNDFISDANFLNDRFLLAGETNGNIFLADVDSLKKTKTWIGHKKAIVSLNELKNQNRFLSTSNDGSLRIWNFDQTEEIAQIIFLEGNEYVISTPEGYFEISNFKLLDNILLRYGNGINAVVKSLALYDVFHRPDIVQAKLRGEDIRPLIGDLTVEKALQNPPPNVQLGAVVNALNVQRIKIPYTILPNKGGVAEVRIFQNGKLFSSDGTYKDAPGKAYAPIAGRSVDASRYAEKKTSDRNATVLEVPGTREANQPGSLRNQMIVRGAPEKICTPGQPKDPCKGEIDIEVIPGEENTITVVAFNRDNTIQSVPANVSFKSTLPKVEPHLWVVGVGINKFAGISSLKNARKDAQDFVCTYAGREALNSQGVPCETDGQARTLFKPKNIHVIAALFDEAATKSHILNALDKVASEAKLGDTLVWFVASHGMMDANSLFGIIAHDTKCLNKDCTDIAGHVTSNEILDASKKIKAMKQLVVLDTCHSGGLDSKLSGLYDARVSLLAKNIGLHLYASAQATELAQDGAPGTNGTFTAQLLEGIKGAAPKNSEGQISVMTLGAYAKQKTVEATAKVGSKDARVTQTPVIQHFGQDVGLARFP